MLQTYDIGRIIIVYITQLSVTLFFSIIAYQILKRNRNQLTYTLGGFYISSAIGFILNAILVLLRIELIVYILYVSTLFLIFFGHFFLVLFNLTLLNIDYKISLKKRYIIMTFYFILTLLIIILPNGFKFNEQTDWRPIWSWSFLLILYIYVICFLIFPNAYLTIKVYRTFTDKDLKKKIRTFFLGASGIWIALCGAMLYNTWDNSLFRIFWSIVGFLIVIPFGFLIYYAMGRGLSK